MPAELELSLPSVPTAVRQMRNAAAEAAAEAGMAEAMVYDVKLAVSEAVTNSVRYGSPAGAQIIMRVAGAPGWLSISITDQGPVDERQKTKGLGLGLPIMTAVTSDLQVAKAASGTVVTMIFRWSAAG